MMMFKGQLKELNNKILKRKMKINLKIP